MELVQAFGLLQRGPADGHRVCRAGADGGPCARALRTTSRGIHFPPKELMSMVEQDPLTSFRLGAVRAGVQATVLTLALLLVFRALPGHGEVSTFAYVLVLVGATAGLIT